MPSSSSLVSSSKHARPGSWVGERQPYSLRIGETDITIHSSRSTTITCRNCVAESLAYRRVVSLWHREEGVERELKLGHPENLLMCFWWGPHRWPVIRVIRPTHWQAPPSSDIIPGPVLLSLGGSVSPPLLLCGTQLIKGTVRD